ncbi:MAG: DUF1844 domain-containing protein [Candidatus Stahlbacteria bacterium]|nr:DUF1844 domain-containing protein [Candidatus Stahlbacteria bacterium]
MEEGKIPEASFASLVLFFVTIASQHLGLVKNPLTDKVERNFELAKYTIDSIGILREKTKGNLTKEEEELLESMLSNLKLTYVREQNKERPQKDNPSNTTGN